MTIPSACCRLRSPHISLRSCAVHALSVGLEANGRRVAIFSGLVIDSSSALVAEDGTEGKEHAQSTPSQPEVKAQI